MTALAGLDYQTPQRMSAKLKAIPLPCMLGRRVLDVGCDAGFFSFLAADRGASEVVGLDRNRHVKGVGYVDLVALNRKRAEDEGRRNVRFEHIDVGKQWHEFGQFEVILLCSLYHHIYECAGGDHRPIWFWLRRHCSSNAVVIWENPTDCSDPVVRANVSASHQANFTKDALLRVAAEYFEGEFIGPALHEPTREVWVFHPKQIESRFLAARVKSGAGGASKAFTYADGRRIREIETILGMRPKPGSLNLETAAPFKWSERYYRAQIRDVVDRSLGLDSEWAMRWARFYPVVGNTFAFRFEDESYPDNFVELIAEYWLADVIGRQQVVLCIACVLKSGGIYDATWAARLKASVAKHLPIAHRFVCLSDVEVPCERIPLEHDWPGWWSKIEALKLAGPVLYFDLDTAAVGDLSDIAVAAMRHPFVMLRDFSRLADGLGSGVMAWNATDGTAAVFHDIFARDPDGWRERIGGRGDQGFIEDIAHLAGITRWQDIVPGQIVSYKIHCHNGIPEKARIVCLHGPPKFADMPAHDPIRRIWEMAASTRQCAGRQVTYVQAPSRPMMLGEKH